jgi:hypothetical protein
VLVRGIAVSIGLLFGLLLGEVALRIVAPQEKSWLDIYRKDPVLPFFSLAPGISATVETGEGRWHVYTDARGHRVARPSSGNAAAGAEPAGPTLLVLGDSFAFGHGVEYEQSFSALVTKQLGADYVLVNTGVPGYGPVQYRQVLESYLASGQRPAAVIVSLFLGNDFMDCVWEKNVQVMDGALVGDASPWRTWLKRNLHGYRLVSKVFQRVVPHARGEISDDELFRSAAWTQGELARAYGIFSAELARIGEICRERGIPVVAVVIPRDVALLPAPPGGSDDPHLPTSKAEEALKSAGIRSVDLTEPLAALGAKSAYFARDGHLTPPANEIAAQEILRSLRDELN